MTKFIVESESDLMMIFPKTNILLLSGIKKVFEFDDNKQFCFDYFFQHQNNFVFHCKFDFEDENYISNCENIKAYKLNQNLYYVKIFSKNTQNFAKKVKKTAKNGIFFNIFSNGLIEIETETEVKYSNNFNFDVADADVVELKNDCFAVKLFGINKEKSVVFDNDFKNMLLFDSAILESTETGFKVLTNLFDIAKHGLVEVFEIEDNIQKVDEYSVYLEGKPCLDFNQKVLPIFFLQCIKANDFREAKNCLSFELNSKSKPEHLKAFFGDFADILIFEDEVYLAYSNFGGNSYTTKKYSFEVANNKISNIW